MTMGIYLFDNKQQTDMKNVTFAFLFFALTATAQQGDPIQDAMQILKERREIGNVQGKLDSLDALLHQTRQAQQLQRDLERLIEFVPPRKWEIIPLAVMIPQPVRPMRRVTVHRKIKAI